MTDFEQFEKIATGKTSIPTKDLIDMYVQGVKRVNQFAKKIRESKMSKEDKKLLKSAGIEVEELNKKAIEIIENSIVRDYVYQKAIEHLLKNKEKAATGKEREQLHDALKAKIDEKNIPKDVKEKAENNFKKMISMHRTELKKTKPKILRRRM